MNGAASTTIPTGYPDGDTRPSVTTMYRRTYTFVPDANGSISFLLAPAFNSAIVLLAGSLSGPGIYAITGYSPSSASGLTGSAGRTDVYGQLPMTGDQTCIAPTPTQANANNEYNAFRPLVVSADVTYTGTTFNDSGSVVVSTVSNYLKERGPSTVAASIPFTVRMFDGSQAGNIGAASSMPSAVVRAARTSFSLSTASSCPAYAPTYSSWITDVDTRPIGVACTGPMADGVFCSPYSLCTAWKAVSYSGLQPSASITVNVRYAVQLSVEDGSPLAPFAIPSPPPTMETKSMIERIVNAIPTSVVNDGLSALAGMAVASVQSRLARHLVPKDELR